MLREKHKWRSHKCESTDAEHRGGVTRSSDEGPVMGLERRGYIIQLETRKQPETG
jgi:RNA-directed DNA polymerase